MEWYGTVIRSWSRKYCFIHALILCRLFFFPLSACSSQVDLKDFLGEIQSASDKVTSFSSSFTQERHLALFSKPVIFHGRLTIIRPEKLRWEFVDPLPSVLIFNGEKGMRCDGQSPPTSFQLARDPVMKSVARQLWLWLGGDYSNLNERYIITMKGRNGLIVKPRDKEVGRYIAAVTIFFNMITKQPEQVEITEPGGDFTRIIFHSYKVNVEVPESLFTRCDGK